MTKDQAVLCVRYLASAYPNTSLSEPTIVIYTRHFMRWPYELTQLAIDRVIGESKFFPSLAEIQDVIWHLETQIPSASEAWEEVMGQIRSCGTWRTPTWSNSMVARVVRVLGWFNLCTSDHSTVDRAHFLKIYSELAEIEKAQKGQATLKHGMDGGRLDDPHR